ncbi:MAG: glycosyltransferase family 4 protein [Chthoniobacterales bacterium]
MIVLITNTTLASNGGTQTVVAEIARLLRQRGHQVMLYSSKLGHVADLLIEDKFAVVSNLRDLPFKPDIIHGQHHLETMSALMALPETPCVYYIHGVTPWQERVPIHPRILGYINLSEISTFRCSVQKCIPLERFYSLGNHINFGLFPTPKTPPTRLGTAAYCPRIAATPATLENVERLCREHGIELHHETEWSRGSIADPLAVYQGYDLIFGTGRTALEALAVGCVVSSTDQEKLGPLITPANIAERRTVNFTMALWEEQTPYTTLSAQLAAYDPAAQQEVYHYIRREADFEKAADDLVQIYEKIIAEWKTMERPSFVDDMTAASDYLRALTPLFADHERVEKMRQAHERIQRRNEVLEARVADLKQKHQTALEVPPKPIQKIIELLRRFAATHPIRRVFIGKLLRRIEELLQTPP